MRTEVVEVIYGKHHVYRVLRLSGFFSTEYQVRTDSGKFQGTFRRLDEAVAWARQRSLKG